MLCYFQVDNMKIPYFYMWSSDDHNGVQLTSITTHAYKCFLVRRTFKTRFLSNFQVCAGVLLTTVTTLCTTFPGLIL